MNCAIYTKAVWSSLYQSQREQFKPCASEIAIHQLAARMGVRLPGAKR